MKFSPHVSTDPAVLAVQEGIIEARQEYASWEKHQNPHEYFGVVEELSHLLAELETVWEQQKALYPEAHCILEYHQSCMLPRDATFLVTSFSLQTRRVIAGQESRLNSFICWKLPIKDDYTMENTAIEQFMQRHGIAPYVDPYEGPSRISYQQFGLGDPDLE